MESLAHCNPCLLSGGARWLDVRLDGRHRSREQRPQLDPPAARAPHPNLVRRAVCKAPPRSAPETFTDAVVH